MKTVFWLSNLLVTAVLGALAMGFLWWFMSNADTIDDWAKNGFPWGAAFTKIFYFVVGIAVWRQIWLWLKKRFGKHQ